jgi:hypothetical protein
MFKWLVLYVTYYSCESRFFHKKIKQALRKCTNGKWKPNTSCDLVLVDMKGAGKIKNGITLYQFDCKTCKIKRLIFPLKNTVREIIMEYCEGPYQGFVYCGHSQGITLGYYPQHIMTVKETADLCKVKANGKMDVIIMDCCYGGTLQTLYELRDASRLCLATPSYHDGWNSFLEFEQFWSMSNQSPVACLKSLAEEYTKRTSFYSEPLDFPIQWCIYDLDVIGEFFVHFEALKRIPHRKKDVIYHNDPSLCDLVGVARERLKILCLVKRSVLGFYKAPCLSPVHFTPMATFVVVPDYIDPWIAREMEAFSAVK